METLLQWFCVKPEYIYCTNHHEHKHFWVHSGQQYTGTRIAVLNDLCSDMIIGYDFQKQHSCLLPQLGESRLERNINSIPVCALSAATVDEPSLFDNLMLSPLQQMFDIYIKDDIHLIQSEWIIVRQRVLVNPAHHNGGYK